MNVGGKLFWATKNQEGNRVLKKNSHKRTSLGYAQYSITQDAMYPAQTSNNFFFLELGFYSFAPKGLYATLLVDCIGFAIAKQFGNASRKGLKRS